MSEFDKLKLALDDIRARYKALTDLITFTDQQAMGLLRLYVTLGLATATGAASSLFGLSPIRIELAWGLVAATICFLGGAWYCFKAMETARLGLIGRGPEFWQWAFEDGIEDRHIIDAYFKAAKAGIEGNRVLNEKTAGYLKRGRQLGPLALIATLLFSLITYGLLNP